MPKQLAHAPYPFGISPEGWNNLASKERWKMNDGALRKRINEGGDFVYIGIDPSHPAEFRRMFDLTGSELLRLEWKGVPYKTIPASEVQTVIGRP